jgi:hypothetical protein
MISELKSGVQMTEKSDELTLMFNFCKSLYNNSRYSEASDILSLLVKCTKNSERVLEGLWGILACEILANNIEKARSDFDKLKEFIDMSNNGLNHIQKLEQRAWLSHWALFVFTPSHSFAELVDFYLLPQYLNTIQTICQPLLRYVAVAVIMSKPEMVPDLVKIINGERGVYSDDITNFISSLYSMDFLTAKKCLHSSKQTFENDYFLKTLYDHYFTSANSILFKIYTRIYCNIKVSSLSHFLGDVKGGLIETLCEKNGLVINDGVINRVNCSDSPKYLDSSMKSFASDYYVRCQNIFAKYEEYMRM